MLRLTIILGALLFASSPSYADGADDMWMPVSQDGYNYLMPPMSCRVSAELPAYTLKTLPQDEMNRLFTPGEASNTIGRYEPNNGHPIIYIAAGLPIMVRYDTLVHELAHLRGCRHDFWDD